jgi:hypothetical protein
MPTNVFLLSLAAGIISAVVFASADRRDAVPRRAFS